MTWKDILKIDMDEARRLGEKYAPKDMKEGRAEVQREQYAKRKNYHNQIYQKMKKKVMDLEDQISASKFERMLDILDDMRDTIGDSTFEAIYDRLGNYPELWDSMKDNTMSRY